MNGSLMKLILVALGAAGLIACKAEVKAGGGGGAPPVQTFDHVVPGPSLDGVWQSSCVDDDWSDEYSVFKIVFKGQDVVREETKFSDPACTNQVKNMVNTGRFRYMEKFVGDIYQVGYWFDSGVITGDNLVLIANQLWISNRRIGSGSMPDIQLNLIDVVQ